MGGYPWPVVWLAVFALMFVLDFVWGHYTKMIVSGGAHQAAAAAVGIYILGGLVTIGYTSDPILLIPASVGAWLGTYIVVKRRKE